jgi:hypothetical protein
VANQFGVGGIIWGTIVAYCGAILLPYGRIIPRQIHEFAKRVGENAASTSQPHTASLLPRD